MNKAEVVRIQKQMTKRCDECASYHQTKGECHHSAPQPIIGIASDAYRVIWAPVKADDFCDEFRRRAI